MIATEADVTTTAPAFASQHSPSHDPVVYTEIQYQSRFDPLLGDDISRLLLAARAAAIWRDFGSPSRLTASDWVEEARIYSPEDEPHLAICWDVFLSGLSRPTSEDLEQVLDWEFAIESEPKRPKGTTQVTLQFAGRDRPLPEEDPWAT